VTIELTKEEARLLIEALDSHVYWQLSDEQYRRDGYIHGKGSDDPEARQEMKRSNKLSEKIARALGGREL
jgi:hypothetical protein